MKNESGGYEIRSASDEYVFKSALVKRDISVIRGRGASPRSVNVFEGMLDFLSLLVLQNATQLEGDAIVMHSVSSFKRTIEFIEGLGYEKVFTFLDNDRVGFQYTQHFKSKFLGKVIHQSHINKNYKDLNDLLVNRNTSSQTLHFE